MAQLALIRRDRPLVARGHTGDLSLMPHSEAELAWPQPSALLWVLERSSWGAVLEDTLQCVAQDAQGVPLLSAFLCLEAFEELLADPDLAREVTDDQRTQVAAWAAWGVTTVVVEGTRQGPREVSSWNASPWQ